MDQPVDLLVVTVGEYLAGLRAMLDARPRLCDAEQNKTTVRAALNLENYARHPRTRPLLEEALRQHCASHSAAATRLKPFLSVTALENATGMLRDALLANKKVPPEDVVAFCETARTVPGFLPWRRSCVGAWLEECRASGVAGGSTLSKDERCLDEAFASTASLKAALALYESSDENEEYRARLVQSFLRFAREADRRDEEEEEEEEENQEEGDEEDVDIIGRFPLLKAALEQCKELLKCQSES